MRQICVIGGNRYFGRHLIRLLRDGGDHVTVVNRGSAAPPSGVEHVVADRADAAALARALAGRTRFYAVDNGRAAALGFPFTDVAARLPRAAADLAA
ncbi:NAD-dependent epimerase/dehydratase family protein [Nonomuraea sp. NPDC052265]|uniref:NAD-dependent epimerase/dehydratase family protein n=1 Tax=Nonomuraea sp. NPDC052265 TaxID=3364374 RepID=UPI0037CA00A9